MNRPTRRSTAGRVYLDLQRLAREMGRSTDEVMLHYVLETMIRRGAVNTRMRDFLDVWLLIRRHSITAVEMRAALAATVKQRGTKLRPLSEAVSGLPERHQADWSRYLGRTDLTTAAPASLAEVLALVKQFADPLITATIAEGRWDPTLGAWTPESA